MSNKVLTVGEVLEAIHDRQLRQSVYVHLAEYLRQFVSTDSHTPAKGIKTLGVAEDAVPEEVVDTVIMELEKVSKTIKGEIDRLKGQRLPEEKRRKP
jgi:hypothetical protein